MRTILHATSETILAYTRAIKPLFCKPSMLAGRGKNVMIEVVE
jgi:hypothetical protein